MGNLEKQQSQLEASQMEMTELLPQESGAHEDIIERLHYQAAVRISIN